jgi:hypothetical protein
MPNFVTGNCDSHFEKGHSHLVCQDYALHEKFENFQFVIVSDGCSSSKDVDVGARLLCHVAKDFLIHYYKTELLEKLHGGINGIAELSSILELSILRKCLELKSSLNMSSSSFDATLLIAIQYKLEVIVMGRGDGSIIFKYADKIKYVRAEYESGAPFYLSYKFSSERLTLYDTQFPGEFVRSHFEKKNSSSLFTLEESNNDRYQTSLYYNSDYDPDFYSEEKDEEEDDRTKENGLQLKSISIASDGLFSFMHNPSHPACLAAGLSGPYDHNLLIPSLIDFKNFSDNFLKRRMRKVEADITKQGLFHDDDLAIGTLYLG